MDCLICRMEQGEALDRPLHEDPLVWAGHAPPEEGESDVYLGRCLMAPRRHAAGVADLSDAEAQAVGLWIARLGRALRASGAEHVYVFVLGHKVPHVHFHVIPRHPGTPREYWGVRVLEWPAAPRGGGEEVREVGARIRAAIDLAPGPAPGSNTGPPSS
ncbi:MAG: HIT family protein [Planctomycetes bacterium]|nr:HIT family protein [Planctomycetota bacterium]